MECPKLDPVELALEQRASELFDKFHAEYTAAGGNLTEDRFHNVMMISGEYREYQKAVYACLDFDETLEMEEEDDEV
jgi:hypothetical protein